MGIQESKVLQRKPTKAKGALSEKLPITEDVADFITQLSTLACLRSTSSSTYEYVAFQKLPFTGHYAALPLCSKISTNSQSVFICYDCATDKQAGYLCQECFEKGNHDSHRFSVFPNNNGWNMLFCRCGDQQYLKKKVICQPHAEAPVIKNESIDKKQLSKFCSYFHQAFKILFGLMEKGRADQLLASVIGYFQKMTDGNLYFSKIVCQFLLETNRIDGQSSNLRKIIKMGGFKNNKWYNVMRNLNFASQYKIPILKEFIYGINESDERANTYFYELIINFAGKTQILNSLAKSENIAFGITEKSNLKNDYFIFYQLMMKTGKDNTELWKCLVRNKKIEEISSNSQIMKAIIKNLAKDQEYITLILEQLLQIKEGGHESYILQCLMILVPQFFVPSLANKKSKGSKNPIERLQKQFIGFYNRLFLDINTHSFGENQPTDLLLILPYFSFGQTIVAKLWEELQKRVEIISKNKEKKVIKEASSNFFQFITKFLTLFMTWDHKVLRDASSFELISFTKDQKLVEKVLIQYFDKHSKLYRADMLQNVDIYTQNQRNLAKDIIKDNLRYNAKKGKYYNISKKLANNSYHFQQINIGAPFKFTEWQQFVSKRFFTQSFFRLIPQLIKIAQKALMDDIELVKTVSNISVCLCLLNKNEKKKIKQVTRNFIKQIPDVRENIYYILAKIRDRLQLDIEDVEEKGRKGTKKVKLDLITEIRDKKFKEIKERHDKIRMKWLKEAEKLQSDHQEEDTQNFCNICKQKDTDKRRFVYPCNFTRNNVVSTMLRSDVTDLDINICLHKMHQDCFEKQRRKGQCPICKFQFNCFLPDKPLGQQSYTKNWLRNFQNIVTSINLQSGKSFNTDWATIFLTYLVFSKSFKVLLKNTQIQDKQRNKVDELILMHYKSQLQKWPELTKQAIKRAEKTVKGQVRRQSNIKKVVKTLVFDLVLQQITNEPIKNPKRMQKKFRELINIVGTENSEKINECFAWSRQNQGIKQVFSSNVAQEVDQLFKIRQLPDQASEYLAKTSIKCPMCSKYRPTTWQCLFCSKISCQNCMYPRNHCQNEHKGTGIILHLSNAQYQLYHQSRQVQMDSLYRNQFEQGWVRNQNPQGWQAKTQQIYNFFDTVLHSQSPFKRPNEQVDDSDNQGVNHNRGWNSRNNNEDEFISEQQQNQEEQHNPDYDNQDEDGQDQEQQDQDQEEEQELEIPRKAMPAKKKAVKMVRAKKSFPAKAPKPAAKRRW